MGKTKARKLAQQGTLSIGDLREMIAQARGREGASNVNPAIPHERALDIYIAALEGRQDQEVPKAWRPDVYSRHGTMKATRDQLIITNILRDTLP